MFARESETRVDLLNHCFHFRAWSRIPNQSELDQANRGLSLGIALKWSELVISFCFRRETDEQFINLNQINRRGHVMLHYYALCVIAPQNSPRAHFMLHYYALRFAARLIGKNVRRRKQTISAKLHRERRFTRSRRLRLLVRPTRSGSLRPQSI